MGIVMCIVSRKHNEITVLIPLQDALYCHIIRFGCNTEVLFLASLCVCVSAEQKNIKAFRFYYGKWALKLTILHVGIILYGLWPSYFLVLQNLN
jgi:hypothetical protein